MRQAWQHGDKGRGRRATLTLLVSLLLLAPGLGRAQIQQPPPSGTNVVHAHIACDGVTQVAAPLQTILDSVPIGSRIVLPSGTCLLNAPLTVTRTLRLEGAGILHTILRQTVANLPVITVTTPHHVVSDSHFSHFTVDHAGTTPVAGGDGMVVNSLLNHLYLENIQANANWRGFVLGCVAFGHGAHLEASQNNSHGFEFLYPAATCGAAQWQIHHTLSQLNRGAGFGGFNGGPGGAANGIGPFLDHTHSFGNELGGYVFIGAPGFPINDIWLLNIAGSSDNQSGLYLDTYGAGHVVSNPWIELSGTQTFARGWPATSTPASHAGNCVSVTTNNLPGLVIMGGFFWNCADAVVALYAPYSSLIGGASTGPGFATSPTLSKRANVSIGAEGVTVQGHTFTHNLHTLSYINFAGTRIKLGIGHNTYGPGLDPTQYINTSEAVLPGTSPPTMAGGVTFHTNTGAAPGVYLYDATGGANGLKVLRVTAGQLQTLNATGDAVLHQLSDAGTPGWPARRGQATIVDNNSTANIGLVPFEPDTAYFVQVTAAASANNPAAGAFTVIGVNKLTSGFELAVSQAPGAGKSVTYNWLVHR